MMLSQGLIDHASFKLDMYDVPRLTPLVRGDYVQNGDIYQIEQVKDHLYYFFPPGSSILSVPFVLVANVFKVSAVKSDGSFDLRGETKIESLLGAFLMALLCAIFYFTARLELPVSYSLLVTVGGALGTQIWSTASRAMFTDTWSSLLLAFVIYRLLAFEVKGSRLRPILLATVLAWAYFVYPSYSVHVAAISVYLMTRFNLKQSIIYCATGAVWIVGLVAYSVYNFGVLLPSYFRPGRLLFGRFWTALAGNLISPSRGFLIFVPTTIVVAYLLMRFRRQIRHRRLVILAVLAITAQLITISGFDHWWGGHSYGPRLMTAFVPWLVLLAIIGSRAMLDSKASELAVKKIELRAVGVAGLLLMCVSVFIHERGATAPATSIWNMLPENVDAHPERIWDWRQPQFLAGLVLPPFPPNVPLLSEGTPIDFTSKDADKYLWYGWSIPETESRWTNGSHATIIFSLSDVRPLTLKLRMAPLLVPGKIDEQRIKIRLNGTTLTTLSMRDAQLTNFSIILPATLTRRQNVIEFDIPGAAVPASLGQGEDQRQLGIRITTIELVRAN